MSDRYVNFENFKWGLDARKSELTIQPGGLLQCQNAHVNQGGELEQRLTYAKSTVGFPACSFGLEETDSGLVTFLSRPLTLNVATRARSSSQATLTFNFNDTLFTVGETILVAGVGGGYDGTYQIIGVFTQGGVDNIVYLNPGGFEPVGTQTNGTVTSVLPVGVTAQTLVYPQTQFVDSKATPLAPAVQLDGVTFSTNFLGKAFVIAHFEDGNQFLYYDGTLLLESSSGLVIKLTNGTTQAVADMATALVLEINAELGPAGWVAVATGARVEIRSPAGLYFVLTVTNTSISGLLGDATIDKDGVGMPVVAATASFAVVGGTQGVDTFQLFAFKDVAGVNPIDLGNGVITCGVNAAATAQLIVNTINNNTALHGYTALLSGSLVFNVLVNNVVNVIAPLSFGAVTFNLTVTTTGTAQAGPPPPAPPPPPNPPPPLMLTLSAPSAYGSDNIFPALSGVVTAKPPITVSVKGGTPGYTYVWTETDNKGTPLSSNKSGIKNLSPNSATTQFNGFVSLQGVRVLNGFWTCAVTDSSSPPLTATSSVVSVMVSCTSHA